MSNNNNGSSSAAVLAAVVATSSAATKRSHNEMETKNNEPSTSNNETSINTKIDNDALFASGMEQIILAKKELALAQKRVELAQLGDKDWSRFHLKKLDFSNWPQFVEVTRLIETSEGNPFDNEHNDNLLDACMSELTVVVVGVHKGTSEASLSIAQCNFGGNEGWQFDDSEGYCMCRKGRMSVKSHGSVETRCIQHETSAALVNKLCEASMELTWRSHVQTDHDSGEILKKECVWALDCTCIYEDKDFYGECYQREMS